MAVGMQKGCGFYVPTSIAWELFITIHRQRAHQLRAPIMHNRVLNTAFCVPHQISISGIDGAQSNIGARRVNPTPKGRFVSGVAIQTLNEQRSYITS